MEEQLGTKYKQNSKKFRFVGLPVYILRCVDKSYTAQTHHDQHIEPKMPPIGPILEYFKNLDIGMATHSPNDDLQHCIAEQLYP